MRRPIPVLLSCALLSGCFGPGEGVEVPRDQIYFPVGLALDGASEHLFVVSSDFDLQYNGGAVQSFELEELEPQLEQRCKVDADCTRSAFDAPVCDTELALCVPRLGASPCPQGDRSDAERLLFPGRCKPIDPQLLKHRSSVKIGAFATDALIRARPATAGPGSPERLFVPVRGDSTLHWIDTDKGALECGQSTTSDHACDDVHRAGDQPSENSRGLTLNTEPFAIDADPSGETIVVTNQTTGTASLFVNGAWDDAGPRLSFAVRIDSSPVLRPVGIAAVPPAGNGYDPFHAYLMTFRNSAQVRLVRFAPDESAEAANDPRPYLVDGGGVGIDANSVGTDSRGIALDSSTRDSAKARCAADDADCLSTAGLVPLDVYVANRAPPTLLVGRTRPPQEYPYFYKTIPLTAGPSRVVVGKVALPNGELETRVFVACFESRRVFIYDPAQARVETEILTGRGPHALAVDVKGKRLFIGQFTDSYVGVYSLDLASPATYGTLLGTLGIPKLPRSSK